MPYAYVEQINHVFDTDHLKVYVTFRHQMQRSEIPQASPPVYDWYPIPDRWLLEADEVPVDIISSEWLDEFTLLLTSDVVDPEPTGVTLAYAGPDEKLCYNWGKQIEPWGPRESFAGYPTTPAPHNSTHENGGADEINVAGLSGLLANTQHSFVDRGDPAAADKNKITLIKDGLWHDWNLASIVPVGALAILLRVYAYTTVAGSSIWFRKKGNANTWNTDAVYAPVASMPAKIPVIVACDTNRIIEYQVNGADWSYLYLTVGGWWL